MGFGVVTGFVKIGVVRTIPVATHRTGSGNRGVNGRSFRRGNCRMACPSKCGS